MPGSKGTNDSDQAAKLCHSCTTRLKAGTGIYHMGKVGKECPLATNKQKPTKSGAVPTRRSTRRRSSSAPASDNHTDSNPGSPNGSRNGSKNGSRSGSRSGSKSRIRDPNADLRQELAELKGLMTQHIANPNLSVTNQNLSQIWKSCLNLMSPILNQIPK